MLPCGMNQDHTLLLHLQVATVRLMVTKVHKTTVKPRVKRLPLGLSFF